MKIDFPLRFRPILKRALWGGTRLEQELLKTAGGNSDVAESWEVCDLPGHVSVVQEGRCAGMSLRQLMQEFPADLLGRDRKLSTFPLLIKFLDASQPLSIQVHPKNSTEKSDGPVQSGKAECWFIMDAQPTSLVAAGLRAGITEPQLREAINHDDLESCLHRFQARPGDCIFLEPGTVHSLGGGLLVAEIQQPSEVTYRLHDWGRVDSQGRPRELHVEAALAAIHFETGPLHPVVPIPFAERQGSKRLVQSPHFEIIKHQGKDDLMLPDDQAMHLFIVTDGEVSQSGLRLHRGETVVIPAARRNSRWNLSEDAVLLDVFLPESF